MKLQRLSFLLGAALLTACSGLAGEPRIVATIPPATPIPTDIGHPTAPPDLALGAQIFAQNCVRCHGAGGSGDGELALSGEVPSPGDFTDPTTAYDQRPVDWYSTITNGNLENLMPPWRDALTEAERWSVAMYTYMLPYTQQQIAHGRDLCGECAVSTFTDLAQMAAVSQSELFNLPTFASLSEADRRDTAAYVRTLALTNVAAIGGAAQIAQAPLATEEVGAQSTAQVENGTINGQVSNGTASSSIPADLALTLFIVFDASLNYQQMDTTASADGSFSFSDVPLDPTFTYIVTTNYRERVFANQLDGADLSADLADGSLNLPVTIYELTEDPDVIQLAGMVTQISAVGSNLEVAQVFNFTNTSDRAFTTSQATDDGRSISLVVTLPPGAVIAGFPSNPNQFVVDQTNFTFFDTVPVLPGEDHVVQVIYLIQYDQGGAIIEQPMNYAVNGPVRLLLRPSTVRVTSEQFVPRGVETVGTSEYQSYGDDLVLAAGDVLRFDLSGAGIDVATQGDRDAPLVSSNNLLLIIGGVLIISALLGGGLFLVASRNRSGDAQVIDILVRQIAELDADHDAGKLDDSAYEQQRSALKARLAVLMERKNKD